MTKTQAFWKLLAEHQLVTDEQPVELEPQPLYLRMFLALTVWQAAISLLLALVAIPVGALLLFTEQMFGVYLGIMGLVLLAGAIWGCRLRKPVFIRPLSVAAALAGQGLVLTSLLYTELLDSVLLAVLLIQLPVFVLVRDLFVRSLCVPLCVLAAVYELVTGTGRSDVWLFLHWLLPVLALAAGWLYLAEVRLCRWRQWLHPLKRGVTLAVWIVLGIQQFGLWLPEAGWQVLFSPWLLTVVAAGFLCWLILYRLHGVQERVYALALGVLVLAAGWFIPGVTVSALLLALAWWQGQRLYWAAHLVVLVVLLMLYYYHLEQTLLFKSLLLLGLATALLGLRFWLLRLVTPAALAQEGA